MHLSSCLTRKSDTFKVDCDKSLVFPDLKIISHCFIVFLELSSVTDDQNSHNLPLL